MLNIIMQIVIMLSVVMLSTIMLSVVMLSTVMLSAIIMSVIVLSIAILSVIILSAIMLSVIMLSVVAPFISLTNLLIKVFPCFQESSSFWHGLVHSGKRRMDEGRVEVVKLQLRQKLG
jgi:hypothetical protein